MGIIRKGFCREGAESLGFFRKLSVILCFPIINGMSLWFILFSVGSCKKSDTTESNASYNKVILFDDTMGSPAVLLNRMASANNRLFMTYGHGDAFTLYTANTKLQVLVTDNAGQLIKHDSLPGGLLISAMQKWAKMVTIEAQK